MFSNTLKQINVPRNQLPLDWTGFLKAFAAPVGGILVIIDGLDLSRTENATLFRDTWKFLGAMGLC
jgi:hypothetical protein